MGQHHAFRLTRGAGRIDQGGQIAVRHGLNGQRFGRQTGIETAGSTRHQPRRCGQFLDARDDPVKPLLGDNHRRRAIRSDLRQA